MGRIRRVAIQALGEVSLSRPTAFMLDALEKAVQNWRQDAKVVHAAIKLVCKWARDGDEVACDCLRRGAVDGKRLLVREATKALQILANPSDERADHYFRQAPKAKEACTKVGD